MNERIFHIERDETVAELAEKIRESFCDDIVFIIPRSSDIFESSVNFQILRTIAEEERKNLIIITLDASAREMVENVGLSVFATLEDREKTPFAKIREHTIGRSRKIRKISIEKISSEERIFSVPEKKIWEKFLSRPSRHAFFFLLFLSAGLFFFIANLALPEATISINPVKKQKESFINIYFFSREVYEERDIRKTGNAIFSFPIEEVFTHELIFNKVSKEFRGKKSKGEITIFNNTFQEKVFKPQTRFQDGTGIIFLSMDWIRIPPRKGDTPGTLTIPVEAALYDSFSNFSGERGNLPAHQKFFLPGLSEGVREQVWAENDQKMNGGITEWVSKITKEDLEQAKKEIEEVLQEKAGEKLEAFIEKKNREEGKNFALLPKGKQLSTDVLEITVDESLVGKELESFPLFGKVRIRNYAYDKNELLSLLESRFSRDLSEGMEFDRIDDNIVAEILDVSENGERIKANFSVQGVEKFMIEPKSASGLHFVNDAKKNILGMPPEQAELYLSNLPEVEEAQVDLWPFWVKAVPTLPENITFQIQND